MRCPHPQGALVILHDLRESTIRQVLRHLKPHMHAHRPYCDFYLGSLSGIESTSSPSFCRIKHDHFIDHHFLRAPNVSLTVHARTSARTHNTDTIGEKNFLRTLGLILCPHPEEKAICKDQTSNNWLSTACKIAVRPASATGKCTCLKLRVLPPLCMLFRRDVDGTRWCALFFFTRD